MHTAKKNYILQKKITAVVAVLFLIKVAAWYMTHSVSILTDALEYTINVVSSIMGLYSLYLSSLPKDHNHPYGHGKVEFISAAIEGTLMIVSSFLIIYEAIYNLRHPHVLLKLDYGIYLIAFTSILNYVIGYYAIKRGRQTNSLALISTGKHMQSDTYATAGIVVGLVLIFFTNYVWIDSIMAFIFALIVIFVGYKIVRQSIAGIMDEADHYLLDKIVALFQSSRRESWIDLHNLRIIKYGSTLHLDCHLTVPWYFNVHEAHQEIDELVRLVKENFGESIELFVHTDGCLDFSCQICSNSNCKVRQFDFVKRINWTVKNISTDSKHRLD